MGNKVRGPEVIVENEPDTGSPRQMSTAVDHDRIRTESGEETAGVHREPALSMPEAAHPASR
jgi:hypothetical protein